MYRLDGRARKLDYLPLTTLDGHVAVPPKLKKEESTAGKRLLDTGFEEEFVEPAVLLFANRYVPLGIDDSGGHILNILCFHIFMAPAVLPLAVVVTVLWFLTASSVRSILRVSFNVEEVVMECEKDNRKRP